MIPLINRKYRQYMLVIITVSALFILYVWYDATHCDLVEQGKLVKPPSGKMIPLFTADLTKAKSFGELSSRCDYNGENNIDCPDVRHLGISMNHQSQLAVARIHAVLDLICKRYDIKYFLNFASLLGARRSGRMLAWDYDGDTGMMIEDYRQFLKHVRQDLPDDLYFQDGSDNPLYKRNPDSKIRDRNSCYTSCLRSGCSWEDGLQVDIFVFRRKEKSGNKIFNYFNPVIFDYDDIFPNKDIKFEGLTLRGPQNVDGALRALYGPDFMTPPPRTTGQCSRTGYVSIPWYSCEYIQNLPKHKKEQVLKMSEDHRSLWYRFHF